MSSESGDNVTLWLHEMVEGDPAAVDKIFRQYFDRLVRVARRQLITDARRDADEEDVAAEAIASFFRGVERNRFPQLSDRDDLWRLLVTLVLRKSTNRLKHARRQKRGGGQVRGESVFGDEESRGLARTVLQAQPGPEAVAEFKELTTRMLANLPSDDLRQIALLRLEGFSNHEIATQMGLAKRTIERKINVIRTSWQAGGEPS